MSKIQQREAASLLIPVLEPGPAGEFSADSPGVLAALELGVGGFILSGGDRESVRAFTKELQLRSTHPLLIGAELERGAGQRFSGATGLPPLEAIAALGDMESLRRAARLTAREARTMGVNWNLAPVADIGVISGNPVLGTRTAAPEGVRAGKLVAAWIEACQAEGVLACAKHFPGIGRITVDPQRKMPRVDATADTLKGNDLLPFRAAITAGVASIMTSHAGYRALDPSGLQASQSREIVQWLLRQQFKYDNLVVADSISQGAATEGRSAADAAVLAIRAGCDVVLDPPDIAATVEALCAAVVDGLLDPEVVKLATRRRLKWAQWASPPNDWRRPSGADTAWGALLADRATQVRNGPLPALGAVTEVVIIDDDNAHDSANAGARVGARVGRAPILEALRNGGTDARQVSAAGISSGGPLVIAFFAELYAGRGRVTLKKSSIKAVKEAIASAERMRRASILVALGDPRFIEELGVDIPTVVAWSGDEVMQQAGARRLQSARS